jgi:hypothetical protein
MLQPACQSQDTGVSALSPQLRAGLGQLLRAFDYSHDLGCSIWDFSVEIERLLAQGMTTSDLRWLIKRGYLVHAQETTAADDADRRFDTISRNLAFFPNSCFVLTASGLEIMGRTVLANDRGDSLAPVLSGKQFREAEGEATANTLGAEASPYLPSQPEQGVEVATSLRLWRAATLDTAVPNWDRETRTFIVGEYLVKRFRVPSPNQEAVLDAFQEEGWPRSVDDPLSPVPDQQPKRRLRDTIKCLNMNQANRAIRFRGDGTGQRVSWELLIDSAGKTLSGAAKTVRRAA